MLKLAPRLQICRRVSRLGARHLGGKADAYQQWAPDSGLLSGVDASSDKYPAPQKDTDWSKMGFSLETKDTKMVVARCAAGDRWGRIDVVPYGPLQLEPAATILNYGQGIFEGIKAFRTKKGRIVVFRPHKNAGRFADGARRMMMPPVAKKLFIEAISVVVRENAHWVPPVDMGALYLRPMLFGSGADLGVRPSSEFTFVVFATPVGHYFGRAGPVRLKICRDNFRAAPGGVGHVKCVGNYSQCFLEQWTAKQDGYSDVLYLHTDGENLEEGAAANIFCVDKNNVVRTPQLGSILAGVTRDSLLQLVRSLRKEGLKLAVGDVSLTTLMEAEEAFLTGTGASIVPIGHISSGEDEVDFDAPGPVTQKLLQMLLDTQMERRPDRYRWLFDPYKESVIRLDSWIDPRM